MGPERPAPALTTRHALLQLLFTRESVRWAIPCLVARFSSFFLDFLIVLAGSWCFCALLLLATHRAGQGNKECSPLVVRGRENKVLLPLEG